jgi:hypothetical protein
MTTKPAPTIEDQIAWMSELVAFQRRQYKTMVETGRMTETDAAHKSCLSEAILASLETLRPNLATHLRDAAADGRMRSPVLFFRVQCADRFEDVSVLNADLIATDQRHRAGFLSVLENKIIAVAKAGLRL